MKEIKLNDEYQVKIFKQDHFGNGIAKIDDVLVFVEDGLTGDICDVMITQVKKSFVRAKIIKIIEKSDDRVEPRCIYYDKCGGCHIMHEDYSRQLEFKQNKVKELFDRYVGIDNVKIFPILSDRQFGYRNKVIFHGNENKLGLYSEKTNEVIHVSKCIIADDKINLIYNNIFKYIKDKSINLKSVMIRVTSTNESMVVFNGDITQDIVNFLEDVSTIYINDKLVKGNLYITEDILGIKFKIYPKSFFQVNYDMMLKMYGLVVDFYKDKKYKNVLDLYCGTGTIGMLVSKYVDYITGVEIEKSSIESALDCVKINNITNMKFLLGKVENYIDTFNNIDSIIVDPPRAGLDKYTIDTILEIKPETIVYISCDPVTLVRDLKLLSQDYNILEIHPIDMFPNTYHVETLCILERK